MSQPSILVDRVVREAVQPVLKSRGFRKSGRTFRRPFALGTQIINVQSSSWNAGDQARFTLNFGVYFPAAAELHGVFPVKEQPLEHDCLIRARIGRLLPDRGDLWWDISPATEIAALARELQSNLTDVGLTWIEATSSFAGARRFCVTRQTPWWEALFALLDNDRAGAETAFANAVSSAGRDEIRNRLIAWGIANGLQSTA